MAEGKLAPVSAAGEKKAGRTVVVVGVDDSEHSYHALEWTVRHVTAGMAGGAGAELVVVHAKPSPSSVVSFGGPAAGAAVRCVEADLRKTADAVVERARRVCVANSVEALIEVVEGEPKNVLCGAAEKHGADLLAVGSHGHGAIKRALQGSVSAYCARHARCSVMIVKRPSPKH
ncbi:hypothetical protein ACP4OV_007161 [Aristida adscensionis]